MTMAAASSEIDDDEFVAVASEDFVDDVDVNMEVDESADSAYISLI